MTTQPTTAAIETAIKNADRKSAQYQFVAPDAIFPDVWIIRNTAKGTRYAVTVDRGTACRCSCPQFEHEGVCLHQKLVDDHRALLAAEEAFEARFDCLAGKF